MAAQPQPAAGPARDLFAEAGMNAPAAGMTTCPACQAPLHQQAVLCVKCGFDKRLGKKVKGVETAAASHSGHGDGAAVLLARAAKAIDDDKAEEAKTRAQGLPAWAYVVLLVLLAATARQLMKTGVAHTLMGLGGVVAGVAFICQIVFGFIYLIRAFRCDPLLALGCFAGSFFVGGAIQSAFFAIFYYQILPEDVAFLYVILYWYRHPISSLGFLVYIPVTRKNWEELNQPFYRYYYCVACVTIGLTIAMMGIFIQYAFPTTSAN